MRLMDLFGPEEAIGNIWHRFVDQDKDAAASSDFSVSFDAVKVTAGVLFRALGGESHVEIQSEAGTKTTHRLSIKDRLQRPDALDFGASFDGEKLRLPPQISIFEDKAQNKRLYLCLVAIAALCRPWDLGCLGPSMTGLDWDLAQIRLNARLARRLKNVAGGLWPDYQNFGQKISQERIAYPRTQEEHAIEVQINKLLLDSAEEMTTDASGMGGGAGYSHFAPVALWVRFENTQSGAALDLEQNKASDFQGAAFATGISKRGERKEQSETNRRDPFIMHRFEGILSWAQSLNINRMVEDDETENAQKAAEDQDKITLSRHDKRAATRLRLHLDLSPADALHERLAGVFTYPEWNARTQSNMPDHCRILEHMAPVDAKEIKQDPKRQRAVARQFEAFRPRRVLTPRALDGDELDLDAVVQSRCDFLSQGHGDDRLWRSARQTERDLSIAFLLDTSRSTEAAIGQSTVLDIAREALSGFAYGVDSIGDRLGIWAFSSLRRERVFVSCVKSFEMPMGVEVARRLAGLRPGHYTRLGAAIRHMSHHLDKAPSSRRLMIVLTDGKPNDLDHYEGRHGIEDTRRAVLEARAQGQNVFGIVIDSDGQDWFGRIFGRAGFVLLPNPERLVHALPEIYKNLTMEM